MTHLLLNMKWLQITHFSPNSNWEEARTVTSMCFLHNAVLEIFDGLKARLATPNIGHSNALFGPNTPCTHALTMLQL